MQSGWAGLADCLWRTDNLKLFLAMNYKVFIFFNWGGGVKYIYIVGIRQWITNLVEVPLNTTCTMYILERNSFLTRGKILQPNRQWNSPPVWLLLHKLQTRKLFPLKKVTQKTFFKNVLRFSRSFYDYHT